MLAQSQPIKRRAPVKEPKVRVRKCAVQSCRTPFQPRNMMHKCCSPDCALAFAVAERERHLKSERRAGLERIKTRQQYLKEAQAAFNAFIRERDRDEPCISCRRYHDGQYHAGHYRSVGAQPALRFNEMNVNKQCAPCNNHLSGNIVEYRIGLLLKIGLTELELLDQDHAPAKYTVEDAKRIKETYRAKLVQLKREK